jgi:hypothetical protein
MSNKKQTAVEWLWDKVYKDFEENGRLRFAHILDILEQAKEMEKQQIIDANIAGMEFIPVDPNKYMQDAEQYYNETYNNI